MKLHLKELNVSDWKGIQNESFQFSESENFLAGANGTGKTSLFAAFVWLLFGKDNFDRTDYHIRPLDENGEPKHHLSSEVEAILIIDGRELRLKRVYREDWVKPKTQTDDVYKGNTSDFYINDVSVQKKDYDLKIAELCSEQVFKAVTNPHFFASLSKENQRGLLFSMIDNITDEQVAEGNADFEQLLKDVSGFSFDTFKKNLNSKMRKVQEELDDIDPRISELNRNKPEPINWDQIGEQVKEKEQKVSEIDLAINDSAKKSEQENNRRLEIQKQINDLNLLNQQLVANEQSNRSQEVEALKTKIREVEIEISNKQKDGKAKQARLDYLVPEKERLLKEKERLLEEYKNINAETLVFPEGSFDCPTCKRPLEIDDIEVKEHELIETFNRAKSERISLNVTKGKAIKAQIELIEKELQEIGDVKIEDVSDLDKKLNDLKSGLAELQVKPIPVTEQYRENETKIADLRASLQTSNPSTTDEQLLTEKETLKVQIKELNSELAKRELIERTETRIAELNRQKGELNQEKANLEKKEFVLKQFEDTKSREYEKRINKLFSVVQFRLFKKQVDGQIVPDCECMADGVLYSTQNNALQFAAGLDIIKAISKHRNIYAPIFIDNRESVTELPEMETQVINLIVDPAFKKLTFIKKSEKQGVLSLE